MKLDESWKEIKGIVLYGFGKQGKAYINFLGTKYTLLHIIDNGVLEIKEWLGVPITDEKEYFNKYHMNGNKILIATAGQNYNEIKSSLSTYGLIEDKDYLRVDRFVTLWNWQFHNKVYLGRVGIIVTERCTLKCEKCSECMPYICQPKDISIESLITQTELMFNIIDAVATVNLVGGETFLYKPLIEYIEYLCENYGDRIGNIMLLTNGTIIPSLDMLKSLKKYKKVQVRISDYSRVLPYRIKLEEFKKCLEENRIEYSVVQFQEWIDFGMAPDKLCIYERSEDIYNHMINCNGQCQGVANNRFYYCVRCWAQERAFNYKAEDKNDYLKLMDIDSSNIEEKEQFVQFYLGNMPKGYSSFCNTCRGYNSNRMVQAAVQIQ